MTEYAGTIRSNLRPATGSWYDERMHTPEEERMTRPEVSDRASSSQLLEEAERRHEQMVASKKRERWAGQERWQGKENEERRMVRILHPHAVIRALRRAGVAAEPSSPILYDWIVGSDGKPTQKRVVLSNARLWLSDESKVGLIGVNAWVRDERTGEKQVKTVSTLQYPYGPEWSLMHFDSFGVVTKERYRGWRTTLLQLIYADVLSEDEVNRAFGRPIENEASLFYRQQLQQYRNRKAGRVA